MNNYYNHKLHPIIDITIYDTNSMITVHLIVTVTSICNTKQNSIYTNITRVHRPASYYSDESIYPT